MFRQFAKVKTVVVMAHLIFSSWALAEEGQSRTEAPVEMQSLQARPFKIFLNGLPAPILSGGFGGRVEYAALRRLSFWFEQEKEVISTGAVVSIFGSNQKSTGTNALTGLTYHFNSSEIPTDRSGLYASAGYKWSRIDVEHDPGILSGTRAGTKMNAEGATLGGGYRFQFGKTQRIQWLVDLGLNYEPGQVLNVKYFGEKGGLFGPTQARVEADVQYGFFPEARIGLQF